MSLAKHTDVSRNYLLSQVTKQMRGISPWYHTWRIIWQLTNQLNFARISQEFPPLSLQLLPENVQSKITEPFNLEDVPGIPDHVVYEKIKRSKKTRSSVPGDLLRRIVKEFAPELAAPAGKIFRNIVQTGDWPKPWRTEYVTPLQKKIIQ